MRIALLSTTEHLDGSDQSLRGLTRIGGHIIARQHVEFALELGCEHIVFLASALHPELLEIQHFVEDTGARFQIIRDIRPLSGLVRSADELLVITDGLAFDAAKAAAEIGSRKTVLTLPAQGRVEAGFERLDRDRAWAGIMLVSGGLVEQMTDLPPDVDVQSSLLRLAMQAGTRTTDAKIEHQEWRLVRSEQIAQSVEAKWLEQAVSPTSLWAPVGHFADRAALGLVQSHSEPGRAAFALAAVASALMAGAAISGFMAYPLVGMGILLAAFVAARIGTTLMRVLRHGKTASRFDRVWPLILALTIDLLIVALSVWAGEKFVRPHVGFAAIVMSLLIWIAAAPKNHFAAEAMRDFLSDRGILIIVLIAGAMLGELLYVIQILVVTLSVFLVVQSYRSRLTVV